MLQLFLWGINSCGHTYFFWMASCLRQRQTERLYSNQFKQSQQVSYMKETSATYWYCKCVVIMDIFLRLCKRWRERARAQTQFWTSANTECKIVFEDFLSPIMKHISCDRGDFLWPIRRLLTSSECRIASSWITMLLAAWPRSWKRHPRQRNRYDYSISTSTEQTNLYHHSNISQLFVTEISGQASAVGNPATDGQRVQSTQPVALWQLSFAKATVENSTPTAHLTENPENRETPQEKDSRVLFTRQKSVYSTLHGILGFVSPPGIKLGSGKHSDPLGRVSVGPEESVFV